MGCLLTEKCLVRGCEVPVKLFDTLATYPPLLMRRRAAVTVHHDLTRWVFLVWWCWLHGTKPRTDGYIVAT